MDLASTIMVTIMTSITAVSTSAVAIVTVRSWKAQRRREDIDRRNKERWERNKKRWESCPLSRVEIVNVRCHGFEGPGAAFTHKMMAIHVTNRSHLPVDFDEPVLQIREVKSEARDSKERQTSKDPTNLGPGEYGTFQRKFSWPEFLDDYQRDCPGKFDSYKFSAWLEEIARKECKIVDLGSLGA